MKWFMFKMLFYKYGFAKTLKKLSDEKVNEYYEKAFIEENYELAAYLRYYLEFKKFKKEIEV